MKPKSKSAETLPVAMRCGAEIFGVCRVAGGAGARFRNAHFAAGARSVSLHATGECEAAFFASHCACVLHCGDMTSADVHHPPAHSVVESASTQMRVMDVTKLRRMFLCLDARLPKTLHLFSPAAPALSDPETRRRPNQKIRHAEPSPRIYNGLVQGNTFLTGVLRP